MPISAGINAPFTPQDFRDSFPIFADAGKFPDAQITMFAELSTLNLSAKVFGKYWLYCCGLFVAHHLSVAQAQANNGEYGYGSGGNVTSESQSVGGASYSVGVDSSYYTRAGDLAQSEWGRILWKYIRMFGAGGGVAWNTAQKSLSGL